jgi:hypothetical protein
VAISQAIERLGGLLSVLAIFVNASKDIPLLAAEVAITKRAFEGLLSEAKDPNGRLASLAQPVQLCLCQVSELEVIILLSSPTVGASGDQTIQEVNRMVWMRNSRKIRKIKNQLNEGISAIQFELLSLQL